MSSLESSAQQMASRVNPQVAQMDPATITLILTNVVPLLLSCLQRRSGAAVDVASVVTEAHRKNPHKLLRNVSYQVRMQARRDGQRITRDQADEIARAIIAQTLEEASQPLIQQMVAELTLEDEAE